MNPPNLTWLWVCKLTLPVVLIQPKLDTQQAFTHLLPLLHESMGRTRGESSVGETGTEARGRVAAREPGIEARERVASESVGPRLGEGGTT